MIKNCLGVIIAAILLFGGVAAAQEAGYSFGYEISKNPSGALRLKIRTEVNAAGMWLGVSLYPPGVKDAAKEVTNKLYPIKQGREITEITIDPKFKNGTFEAAVWSKKLAKEECLKTDEICRKQGYRMTGMSSYIWGHLNSP